MELVADYEAGMPVRIIAVKYGVDLRAMRAGEAHVLDDGDAAVDDVAAGIAHVLPPVDHRERKQLFLAEQEDGRHGESLVQLTCDGCQLAARPTLALQIDGKKDEGLNLALCQLAIRAYRCLPQSQ